MFHRWPTGCRHDPCRVLRLESGLFRRRNSGGIAGLGRIVLIEHLEAGVVYTVKVHGEEWTLKRPGVHPRSETTE